MKIDDLLILQNQASFSTPLYRDRVTALPEALRRLNFPEFIVNTAIKSCLCGFYLYICAFRYDAVVSVSLFPSFIYGLLCRFLIKPNALHICKEFYLEDQRNRSFYKRIRLFLLRFSLKNVNAVIINASAEQEYYSNILKLPKHRFKFIPWPSNIIDNGVIVTDEGYFLAVGKSLRDWKTFFNAIAGTPFKYIVIASPEDAQLFPNFDNVIIKVNVDYQEYLRILQNAYCIILPLVPTIRSTGQASFLEAMAFGKPVIASDVVGVRDYLCNNDNALLCPPEDELSLKECIFRIANDRHLAREIGKNGFSSVKNTFNKTKYAESMLNLIEKLHNTA